MKYEWSRKAIWLMPGRWHNWNLGYDIPQMPRIYTGDRVMLKPQPFPNQRNKDVGKIKCRIYYLPDVNIYIAIGENAYKSASVLFYDWISFRTEYERKYNVPLDIDD